MKHKEPTWLDWTVLIGLGIVWGGSFLMIKKALVVYSPVQTALMRMGIASVAYLPLALIYFKKIDWKKWRPLLVVSLCGSGIPNFLFALAQTKIPSAIAGTLNSLTPLFTLIIGVFFFQMSYNKYKILGVTISFVGAAILILMKSGGQIALGDEAYFAVFCIIATICYAINANVVSTTLQSFPPTAIGAASFFLTAPVYWAGLYFSGAYEVTMAHPDPSVALYCLSWLAIGSTTLASIVFYYLIQRTGAIFSTSVTYLLPVTAIILGGLDGEKINIVHFLGTGMILAGLYLARK